MFYAQVYIQERPLSYNSLVAALETLDLMGRDEVILDLPSLVHFKLALISLARDDKRERSDKKGIVRSAKVKKARELQVQGITQWCLNHVIKLNAD